MKKNCMRPGKTRAPSFLITSSLISYYTLKPVTNFTYLLPKSDIQLIPIIYQHLKSFSALKIKPNSLPL